MIVEFSDWSGLGHVLEPGGGVSPPKLQSVNRGVVHSQRKAEVLLLEHGEMDVDAIEVFYIDLLWIYLPGWVPLSLSDPSSSRMRQIHLFHHFCDFCKHEVVEGQRH